MNCNEIAMRQGYAVEPKKDYCSIFNESRDNLCINLSEYTSCEVMPDPVVEVFPSGMNAICAMIYSVFLSNSEENNGQVPHFIFGDEMDTDLEYTINFFQRTHKFTLDFVDIRDSKAIFDLFEKKSENLRLFYIESCTNPSGQMFDFSTLYDLKNISPKCIVVVNNTWLTCELFNPLQYGADLMIESMKEYISESKCMGGMISGDKRYMNNNINYYVEINGLFINPGQCSIYAVGLESLGYRMKVVGEMAYSVGKWLESKSEVNRVMYPFLESHPTYDLNCRQISKSYGPGVVLFHVSKKLESRGCMNEWFKEYGMKDETSYGSSYSKLDKWLSLGRMDKYDSDKVLLEGIWIRITIGYKSVLVEDLKCLEKLLNCCEEVKY